MCYSTVVNNYTSSGGRVCPVGGSKGGQLVFGSSALRGISHFRGGNSSMFNLLEMSNNIAAFFFRPKGEIWMLNSKLIWLKCREESCVFCRSGSSSFSWTLYPSRWRGVWGERPSALSTVGRSLKGRRRLLRRLATTGIYLVSFIQVTAFINMHFCWTVTWWRSESAFFRPRVSFTVCAAESSSESSSSPSGLQRTVV